jgi:CRISPR-associated protein Csm4
VQRVHFASDAGLYFIIQFAGTDTEAQQRNRRRFESCLQLLADSGVGTDRTSGTGWFTWKVPLDLTMTVPERANRFLNLGLYCPAVDEPALKDLQHASYELVKRGGWIASAEQTEHLSWRKKSVYMFREGSVFTHQPTGKYVDLAPDGCNHPIWRDGRPLVIPVAVTEA